MVTRQESANRASHANADTGPGQAGESKAEVRPVAEMMQQVEPVRDYQPMSEVVEMLDKASRSGTPVVDEHWQCVGILTRTDIGRYRELQRRHDNRDESVIEEMFETDEFGQRRSVNLDFHLVRRHMTAPAVVIARSATCEEAHRRFENYPHIHHLVVVDENGRAAGILPREVLARRNS